MPRRAKPKSSLFAPAGSLLKKLSSANARTRSRFLHWGIWGVSLFFVYSLMSGTYGIPRIVRLSMEKNALIEANRHYTIELVDATRVRKLLLHDRSFIEQIARSQFHMVRQNETIYRYRGQ